ncbi:uncharacterized protein LOC128342258 isoform X2 [Hemicordylus capensis]|uniref:uncharacterized protein LOC128342258 isoform X2 n=1 Tax=Hemicordylus capensis TaxID=884348 RepID=UPI0023040633|nr:uncharacterized protein LOC128342258 isoform X2 [Hemicordylus capensis]
MLLHVKLPDGRKSLCMMKMEDTLKAEVQNEKKNKQETHSKSLKKQQKNRISPWKTAKKKKKRLQLQTHEVEDNYCESKSESNPESVDIWTGHQHSEGRNLSAPQSSDQETSKPLLQLTEDSTDDFSTELTLFNDSVATSNLKSCNEYLPYYRTYASLLETPLDITTEVKHENTEREGGVQSNGCVFQDKYEDEPLHDTDIASGYFPYYRSYEEYFGSSDPPSETHSAENEEAETNSKEETESENDYEIEEAYEDTVFHENGATSKDTSQCSGLEVTESYLLSNPIIEPFDSEISFFDELLSLNRPSSSGYFPYYRTYGKLLPSPEASSTVLSSQEDVFKGFGMELEGTGEGTKDYNSAGCPVC